MFDMADHEALPNGLQNPMIPTSSNNLFWALPGFTLRWERLCGFPESEPRWMPSPHHCLSPLSSHESCFTFPFTSLILSHWLHPAHFNLIFLPHVPRPSVDESVQRLPCLMQVWKLGTFPPKDQNKQVRVKDHETIGSQAKHKSFEHNIHTRVNSGLPLCTWAGALPSPAPYTEGYMATRICGGRKGTLEHSSQVSVTFQQISHKMLVIFSHPCQNSEARMVWEFWFLTLKLSPEEFKT